MPTIRQRLAAALRLSDYTPTATRARLAGPPKSTQGRGVPTREVTPELYPKALRGQTGNGGQLDRMERGHPRIGAGCRRLALGIGAQPPVLSAVDDETARERQFRELMQRLCVDEVFTDATNGARGWDRIAAPLSQYWTRGTSIFALRYVSDSGSTYDGFAALDGLALEAYPVHVSSVTEWVTESTASDRLTGIVQGTSGRGSVTIPARDLVHLQHSGAVGEWEGVSILRPLVFLFERWAGIVSAAEKNSHLAGGLIVAAQPVASDDEDAAVLVGQLNALGLPYVLLPQGYATGDIDIRYPSGTAPSPDATLAYVDAQIDQVFGDALQSLGFSTHGSRALGEELAGAGDWQSTAQLIELYRGYVGSVCRWVAASIGYHGRMPVVSLDRDEAEADDDAVATLGPAVTQGLITWTPEDEAGLRSKLGLAPMRKADSPVSTPATLQEPESYEPPEGVRETAARALEMRRDLPPSRRGGTEVGLARARDLANGRPVSRETLRRMKAYFDRHEVDRDAEGFKRGEEGYPSKGRIAWDLWGGDAGRAWATDKLRGLDASECGCGSCRVTYAAPLHTVIGADGLPFDSPVQLVGIESAVEWATIDRQREDLDAALTAEIERLAERHRAETWDALRDGWQPGEREDVRGRARDRYMTAITSYAGRNAALVSEHAEREMRRQTQGRVSVVPQGEGVTEVAPARENERIRAAIAAEEIASRVQSEVERAWTAGVTRASFASRITAAGLSMSARSIGRARESVGRLEAARDLARQNPDLVIKSVIRSSVRDRNRCAVCAKRHGTAFDLPRQRAEFEAMELPDPDCEGSAERCRCGWLIEWGRRG